MPICTTFRTNLNRAIHAKNERLGPRAADRDRRPTRQARRRKTDGSSQEERAPSQNSAVLRSRRRSYVEVAGGGANAPIDVEKMALRGPNGHAELQQLHADLFAEEKVHNLQEHFALREAIIKELTD